MKKETKTKNIELKRFFKWAGLILVGLIVLGFFYESIAEFIDAKTLKPPGQLVDVDGRKMHIYCTGENKEGKPTVVLEAGGFQNYTTWAKIQPKIAEYTKICAYDRFGLGFSESANDERGNEEVVSQLEILLKNSNITGPYVMVGHSVGGFYTRMFTKRNQRNVKGLLQLDPSVEEMASLSDDSNNFMQKAQINVLRFVYKIGIPRLIMTIAPTAVGVDKENIKIERAFYSTQLNNRNKNEDGSGAMKNMGEFSTASSFGTLPVVVLSGDRSLAQMSSMYGEGVRSWHEDLAKRLSTNNRHILVKNSGHFIQNDQPQIVIDSILELIK